MISGALIIFAMRVAIVAAHCNTLQHTATHFIALQHMATHCNTLQHAATHLEVLMMIRGTHNLCNTLQHTATHCNTLQHTATHSNTPGGAYGDQGHPSSLQCALPLLLAHPVSCVT